MSADSNLFQFWEEVDNDAKWVHAAMESLSLGTEFAELSLADQQLTLALALHLKHSHRAGCIGQC